MCPLLPAPGGCIKPTRFAGWAAGGVMSRGNCGRTRACGFGPLQLALHPCPLQRCLPTLPTGEFVVFRLLEVLHKRRRIWANAAALTSMRG